MDQAMHDMISRAAVAAYVACRTYAAGAPLDRATLASAVGAAVVAAIPPDVFDTRVTQQPAFSPSELSPVTQLNQPTALLNLGENDDESSEDDSVVHSPSKSRARKRATIASTSSSNNSDSDDSWLVNDLGTENKSAETQPQPGRLRPPSLSPLLGDESESDVMQWLADMAAINAQQRAEVGSELDTDSNSAETEPSDESSGDESDDAMEVTPAIPDAPTPRTEHEWIRLRGEVALVDRVSGVRFKVVPRFYRGWPVFYARDHPRMPGRWVLFRDGGRWYSNGGQVDYNDARSPYRTFHMRRHEAIAHVPGGDDNLPPLGMGWVRVADSEPVQISLSIAPSFHITLEREQVWSTRVVNPLEAREWILTMMLCNASRATALPPLPLEILFLVFEHLRVGDMME